MTTTRNNSDHVPAGDSAEIVSSRLGRRRFLQGLGLAAGAGVAAAVLPATGGVQALAAGASQFIPLPVVKRVVDTRNPGAYNYSTFGDNYIRVPIAGLYGVPVDATAVVATITAVNLAGGNWVTVVPAGTDVVGLLGQNRLASALNMSYFYEATANLTQVKLNAGAVDVFSLGPCYMILDVIGYYKPVSSAREGRFVPLETALRAIDTRQSFGHVASNDTLEVDVTDYVTPTASSAVVNLTATECTGAGFFTVYPFGTTLPEASCLNVNGPGATRAAAVIVPITTVGGRRKINVYVQTAAKIIVDVTGYYTNSTVALGQNGLFVPVDPVRILDTRNPGDIGRLWPGWIVERGVPAPANTTAAAVAVNLTGVNSRAAGYLTIGGARSFAVPAQTSNLNFVAPGQVVPNHAITPITASGIWVYASHGADVIVDYLGYFVGQPQIQRFGPPNNPPPPPIGPEWILRVPSIGLVSRVLEGDPTRITNAGHSWHWAGTGDLGQDAHVAAFAHRTEHGGAYRYINQMQGGETFTVTAWDGREFTYVVVRGEITDNRTANILAATRQYPGTTFSLIACSEPDWSPTSLSYRLVMTGALVGWRQT